MTAIVSKMPFALRLSAEMKRFLNWCLVWVVLANAGFMTLWFVGAPPRIYEIMLFGIVGLIVKRFNFWTQFIAFIVAMTWSTLTFIGGLFNLNVFSLIHSIQFFLEIRPGNSVEYIVVGGICLLMVAAAFRLLRRDTNFSAAPYIVSAGVIFIGLALIDLKMGEGMRGHYKRSAPAGAVFGSAMQKTGFALRADGKRHLMLVMVESLGVPQGNAEMSKLLFAKYKNSPAVKQRYEISQGTNPYYVSTTAGEVRELCGRWGDYFDLVDAKDDSCLPAQLREKGYATHAMHSFTGDFFDRSDWYPNIGFDQSEFSADLQRKGAEWCGGVFAGACDRHIPTQMAKLLKAAEKPTFLYFLTLNTHLPVPSGMNLNVENCDRVSPVLAAEFPQICRQFAIWNDIDIAMIREITAADFPETDILIVGDHMPPYFDRHHRSQFDPENVPWLYLKAKGKQEN